MSHRDCATAEAPKGTPRQMARILDLIARQDLDREQCNQLAEYLPPLLKAIEFRRIPQLSTFNRLLPALQAADRWELVDDEQSVFDEYLADLCEAIVDGQILSRSELRQKLGIHDWGLEIYVRYQLSAEEAVRRGDYREVFTGQPLDFFSTPDRPKGSHVLYPKLRRLREPHPFCSLSGYLQERGLRAGTYEELLAFGAKYPHYQLRYAIIAAGSMVSPDSETERERAWYMPMLTVNEAKERILGALRVDYQSVMPDKRLLVFNVID